MRRRRIFGRHWGAEPEADLEIVGVVYLSRALALGPEKYVTPLIESVMSGDVDQVLQCLQKNDAFEGPVGDYYLNVRVNLAVHHPTMPVARLAYSALMVASILGHLDIVELLVQRGAGVNVTDEHDRTSLDLAQEYGNEAVADFLFFHEQAPARRRCAIY